MYRTNAKPIELLGQRWGATTYIKWYVRIVGSVFDLKYKYLEVRELKKYRRALKAYAEVLIEIEHLKHQVIGLKIKPHPVPPSPPPIYISE